MTQNDTITRVDSGSGAKEGVGYPRLVNDSRLHPDLKRIRSGRKQVFSLPWKPGKKEEIFCTLEPPERHIYATLIMNQWYWVNGCSECIGNDRSWRTYIECEKHDRCAMCSTHRSKLKDAPWGRSAGWVCKPCADTEHQIEKAEALGRMGEKKYSAWDYMNRDTIVCPYCDLEWEDPFEHCTAENEKMDCDRCDNKFKVTAEQTVNFSMEQI